MKQIGKLLDRAAIKKVSGGYEGNASCIVACSYSPPFFCYGDCSGYSDNQFVVCDGRMYTCDPQSGWVRR